MHIISREDARAQGLTQFFTGEPCVRGHMSPRMIGSRSCLDCQKIYNKRTIEKNGRRPLSYEAKKRAAIKSKSYHQKNRDACLEKMRARNRIYYLKNKYRIKEQVAAYAKGNQKVTDYKRAWQKERRDTDPAFKMIGVMRRMLHRALGVSGEKKYKNTRDYLPYSSVELARHLESQFVGGMSWSNYGEWHIDHIQPLSALIKSGITDPALLNALSNLQPLWAKDNMAKGGRVGMAGV